MDITIVVPISRKTFLKEFFASLEALECDLDHAKLLLYIDGSIELYQKVQLHVATSKFTTTMIFRGKGIPGDSGVRRRRQRIADIHNELKEKIPVCDYVFLLEDDTLVPANALQQLLILQDDNVGIASGVEIGRHGFPIIGAWMRIGDIIKSVKLAAEDIVLDVSATGLYCCLVRYELYKANIFKPFGEILGPDVAFGLWLKDKGYNNCIDYGIKCIHLTQKEPLTFENTKTMTITFTKENDGWRQTWN